MGLDLSMVSQDQEGTGNGTVNIIYNDIDLTHWGRDKVADSSQIVFLNVFI